MNSMQSFLNLLNVKYTKSYITQHFSEHPHKYNLYGLSSILTDYGIENSGVKITNKADIHLIDCPFIAHVGDDFVIVEKLNKSEVYFKQVDKQIRVSLDEFYNMWTGYVLIAEANELSIEPEYAKHKREEFFLKAQKTTPLFLSFFILFYSVFFFQSYTNTAFILLFAINPIGVYIGYLLVLKQLHIQSNYADKLCSLFKQSDCNSILESDASRFLGFLGWSEVGLGYFISNIFILSFLPSFVTYLAFINLVALPYTFWSVWYQKYKAKQWCPLCLLVLILLWVIFALNLFFDHLHLPSFSTLNLLLIGSVYMVVILTLNMLVPIIAKGMNVSNIKYEINSIKADENVFNTLLTKEPQYSVSKIPHKCYLEIQNRKA